jgi:hypothetical protein
VASPFPTIRQTTTLFEIRPTFIENGRINSVATRTSDTGDDRRGVFPKEGEDGGDNDDDEPNIRNEKNLIESFADSVDSATSPSTDISPDLVSNEYYASSPSSSSSTVASQRHQKRMTTMVTTTTTTTMTTMMTAAMTANATTTDPIRTIPEYRTNGIEPSFKIPADRPFVSYSAVKIGSKRRKKQRKIPTAAQIKAFEELERADSQTAFSLLTCGSRSELANLEERRNTCMAVVDRLFFSEERTAIFEKMEDKRAKEAKKMLMKYYQSEYKKGKLPVLPDAYAVYRTACKPDYFRTKALPFDVSVVKTICDVVLLQWNLVCLSPYGVENDGRLSFLNHVLAVLQCIRRGGHVWHQKIVIPGHKYVTKYMPPVADLDKYGYGKKHVTEGTKALRSAYRSIKENGWPMPYRMLQSYHTDEPDRLLRPIRSSNVVSS